MSVKPNFGGKDLPLVFKGDKLVYPNPVKDGLVLWYDFAGMRNTDINRDVAKDLSDNGNHGELQNFNYTAESGYDKNRLLFDGVDDKLQIPELALDETAMTVVHDGKIYSYEDDKVLATKDYSDKELTYLESLRAKGRNLIRGSEFKEQTSYYTYQNIDAELSGGVLIATNKITTSYPRIFYRPLGDLIVGEEYTISFKARGNTDFTASFWVSDANGGKSQLPSQNVSYAKEWKSYTFTFTANENLSDSTAIQWWVNKTNPDTIQSLFLKEVKLEKGTVTTDWTPAPEDVREELPGLEVGGRNLLPAFTNEKWNNRADVLGDYHIQSPLGRSWTVLSTIIIPVTPNTDYSITVLSDLGRARVLGDVNTIMSYSTGNFSETFNTGENTEIEVELGVFSGNASEEINFYNIMLNRGNIPLDWTPAPEDFQTTTLSPSSLSNLQLYNRSLRKNELLHNTESAGLKELVDGVPVQDGLVLHYDFSKESNTSEYREKAFDYSGNGNHGVLNNFNYTDESGYADDGLKFDGVDDYVSVDIPINDFTITFTLELSGTDDQFFFGGDRNTFYLRKYLGDRLHASVFADTQMTINSPGVFKNTGESEKHFVGLILDSQRLKVGLIHNGIIIQEENLTSSTIPFNLRTLGEWWSDSRRMSGSMFSASVYNRAITLEEIAHNYAIEKERFGIE